MTLHGKNFIGFSLSNQGSKTYQAENPTQGEVLPGEFHTATLDEIESCCQKAEQAYLSYKLVSGSDKAKFLRKIAQNIIDLGPALIERCVAETGLPEARITGERGRTCGQLNLFADLIEKGSWVNARIDAAQPDRTPLPKPDVRSMERALGPVAVFGASNFPLAFSTAGGDTASALAAGCPVVYKAHPGHPGATELVTSAIVEAIRECGLPEGVFTMIHSPTAEGGQALVQNPNIKAVGFTGSLNAGRAIYNTAAARPEPIPVYAEMGSSNPVLLLPETLKLHAETIATGLSGSICLGAGQFCTNPGMTILIEDETTEKFIQLLSENIKNSAAGTVVHHSIKQGYDKALQAKLNAQGVEVLSQSESVNANADTSVQPSLFKASAETVINNPNLQDEVFGPCTFIVTCKDKIQVRELIQHLDGQLTASIFGENSDLETFQQEIALLENKAGRLIINQYPTGVEVCSAMFHGGPYPASTDPKSTSVGTLAIHRFTRPVCYQNFPQSLLPDELKDSNPLKIEQMLN